MKTLIDFVKMMVKYGTITPEEGVSYLGETRRNVTWHKFKTVTFCPFSSQTLNILYIQNQTHHLER